MPPARRRCSRRGRTRADAVASAPVILVALSPVAAAPPAPPNEVAPGPAQPQAEEQPAADKPVEEAKAEPAPEQAPVPEPKIEIRRRRRRSRSAVLPPPKPKHVEKKKPKQRHANLASAPSPAEQRAERAVAPAPGAAANANAVANWKSRLVAQIERHKSFPAEARGEHGTVQVAFSVDRQGGVHHRARAALVRLEPARPRRLGVAGACAAVAGAAAGSRRRADPDRGAAALQRALSFLGARFEPRRPRTRRRSSPAPARATPPLASAPASRQSARRSIAGRAAWRAKWRAPASRRRGLRPARARPARRASSPAYRPRWWPPDRRGSASRCRPAARRCGHGR